MKVKVIEARYDHIPYVPTPAPVKTNRDAALQIKKVLKSKGVNVLSFFSLGAATVFGITNGFPENASLTAIASGWELQRLIRNRNN